MASLYKQSITLLLSKQKSSAQLFQRTKIQIQTIKHYVSECLPTLNLEYDNQELYNSYVKSIMKRAIFPCVM